MMMMMMMMDVLHVTMKMYKANRVSVSRKSALKT